MEVDHEQIRRIVVSPNAITQIRHNYHYVFTCMYVNCMYMFTKI